MGALQDNENTRVLDRCRLNPFCLPACVRTNRTCFIEGAESGRSTRPTAHAHDYYCLQVALSTIGDEATFVHLTMLPVSGLPALVPKENILLFPAPLAVFRSYRLFIPPVGVSAKFSME